MSFMEHQVLGYKSPLYGRRTAQIKVQPFDIMQASLLLGGSSSEDIVTWYGIAGGIPLYLEQFDAALSLAENLATNVLQPDCFLFGEPDSFLQQEVREPARYNAVIRAIANGGGRLTDIADAAGIERTAAAGYLKGLEELGIVRLEKPVVDANRKKTRYVLNDNLFRFGIASSPATSRLFKQGAPRKWRARLPQTTSPRSRARCSRKCVASGSSLPQGAARFPSSLRSGDGGAPTTRAGAGGDRHRGSLRRRLDDMWGVQVAGQADRHRSPPHLAAPRFPLSEAPAKQRLFLFSKSGFTDACRAESCIVRLPPCDACGYGAKDNRIDPLGRLCLA